MKKFTKTFVVGATLFTALNCSRQDEVIAESIYTPITISKNVDLNFGKIQSSSIAGTVVLDPNGERSSGVVILPSVRAKATAARFTISGQSDYTYTVSLSDSCTIRSGSNTLIVSRFTSTPAAIGTLGSGTQTLTIGATLNIPAAQPAGVYRNASGVEVTVNYN